MNTKTMNGNKIMVTEGNGLLILHLPENMMGKQNILWYWN